MSVSSATNRDSELPKDTAGEIMARFKKGHYVAHILLGDGVVTEDWPIIEVAYDRGKNNVGKYDERWFGLYPRYLFHRTPTERR